MAKRTRNKEPMSFNTERYPEQKESLKKASSRDKKSNPSHKKTSKSSTKKEYDDKAVSKELKKAGVKKSAHKLTKSILKGR